MAQLRIGRGANVAAGRVVVENVPAAAMTSGRACQVTKERRAAHLRAKVQTFAAAAKRIKK